MTSSQVLTYTRLACVQTIRRTSFDDRWQNLLCLVEMQGLICSEFSGLSRLLDPF